MSAVPKITGAKRVVQPPKVVSIKSQDESKNIEEVKKMIQTTIQPKDLGIKVRKLVKTARGIMVETDKADELKTLQECKALRSKGLVIEALRKRSPKLMIYDLEADRAEQEVVEDIFAQNVDDLISRDDFLKEFKCVHKYLSRNRNDSRTNWVAECSARVRNILRRRDRLFLGWQSCRVKDCHPVVRCYKCLAYGHISRHCKGKQMCAHCTGEHDIKDCDKNDQPAKCLNSKMPKKDTNYSTGTKGCTEYERACRIALEKVP